MGSPTNFVNQLNNKDLSLGPASSVDKSELFQVQGLNTTFSSANNAPLSFVPPVNDVFAKKTITRPKMLHNQLLQSIKVDGRTNTVLKNSSLGQVQQKLDAIVDQQQIKSIQITRERIENRAQNEKQETAMRHSINCEMDQRDEGDLSMEVVAPEDYRRQSRKSKQISQAKAAALAITLEDKLNLMKPIRNSRESARSIRESFQSNRGSSGVIGHYTRDSKVKAAAATSKTTANRYREEPEQHS